MIKSLLLIGRVPEGNVLAARALSQTRQARLVANVSEAVAALEPAQLIIVFQHWSDEYTASDVDALLAAFPLARIIVWQGSWCASDGRTRRLWPRSLCVPADQAEDRFARELDVIAGERPPLPLTAGLDEIFAFDQEA